MSMKRYTENVYTQTDSLDWMVGNENLFQKGNECLLNSRQKVRSLVYLFGTQFQTMDTKVLCCPTAHILMPAPISDKKQ